jgi:cobalamin biosynthesis protein CbiD
VFPHPRDYQNSPAGTYEAHADEARRRLEMLREVYSLYGADLLAVDEVVARSTVHRKRAP